MNPDARKDLSVGEYLGALVRECFQSLLEGSYPRFTVAHFIAAAKARLNLGFVIEFISKTPRAIHDKALLLFSKKLIVLISLVYKMFLNVNIRLLNIIKFK